MLDCLAGIYVAHPGQVCLAIDSVIDEAAGGTCFLPGMSSAAELDSEANAPLTSRRVRSAAQTRLSCRVAVTLRGKPPDPEEANTSQTENSTSVLAAITLNVTFAVVGS